MNIKTLLAGMTLVAFANMAFAGKIAVLNHEVAMMNTDRAKQASADLQAQPDYVKLMNQAENLRADLEALVKEANTKGMTWSEEQKAEHNKKRGYIQADMELTVKKLQAEQKPLVQALGVELQKKIPAILQKIMKEEGIDIILRPDVAYLADPKIDITDKVTAELNKSLK
ncbi:periplasmic chaperone for outer membrane proteins Skp [Alteromonadaceae bacterium Bs31]|nr:periplasmic chaperone for outer membrane proteins Skp [Alteromonadaceae bacterium Bs31]